MITPQILVLNGISLPEIQSITPSLECELGAVVDSLCFDDLTFIAQKIPSADLVVLAISPILGLLPQDKILGRMASIFGCKKLVVLVTDIEEIDCDESRFKEISTECHQFFNELSFDIFSVIPFTCSENSCLPWFKGPSLKDITSAIDEPTADNVDSSTIPVESADQFTGRFFWLSSVPLVSGRDLQLSYDDQQAVATVMDLKGKIDLQDGKSVTAKKLFKTEFADMDLSLSGNIGLQPFAKDNERKVVSLYEKDGTLAALGVIRHVLRRASNIVWQEVDITREIRAEQKQQTPKTLWFTGLSGSGKSTIANAVEKKLVDLGYHTMLLDGDNVRHGLNKNLGFNETD